VTAIARVLGEVARGERRLTDAEAAEAWRAPFHVLARAANAARERVTDPRVVTYVCDRNINYTNVCNAFCSFCAFYRTEKDKDAYVLSIDEILAKVEPLVALGGTQVLLQGGLNEKAALGYVEDVFRAVKARFPTVDLHSLTATEIDFFAKTEGITHEEVLRRLKAAGMRSLPGGGMEILSDRVRARVSPLKSPADVYIDIHRTAHRLGMPTTATMMFGMGEALEDRIEHWRRVRALQDETKGFTAFIPWTFQSDGSTALKHPTATADEYLRVIALSRLYLDNIAHVQSGWVTEGPKVAEVALACGADDWGGILMEENVISAAGTLFGMNPAACRRAIRDAGYVPAQRNTYYEILKRFDAPTEDERPVPPGDRLAVHLGAVGNRGRPARVTLGGR